MKRNKRMSFIKKNKKLIIAASLLATLAVGETFAWIAPTVSVKNELTAHETKVELEEDFTPGAGTVGTQDKKVRFINTGNSDVFLRMSYEEYWEKGSGDNKILLSNTIQLQNGSKEEVATKIFNGATKTKPDPDLWQDEGDGWYYYKKILSPGARTDDVLSQVKFEHSDYTGDYAAYEGAKYYLFFKVEAVQASTGGKTLNSPEVNAKATAEVFGNGNIPWASVDTGTHAVTWHDTDNPYRTQQ